MKKPFSAAVRRPRADLPNAERMRRARMRTKAEAAAADHSQVVLRATNVLGSACHGRTRRSMIQRLARRAARCLKQAREPLSNAE